MTFRFARAGAFVPVAVLFVTLFGAEAGAWAQDKGPEAPIEASENPEDTAVPRFVSQEVVQPLPTQKSLDERVEDATSLHELVGDMPVAEPLAPDMQCLAQGIDFGARAEPLQGPLARARAV